MSRHTDEGGVDLVDQQDSGFSIEIAVRKFRRRLTDEEKAEARTVSGEIATFAESRGLDYSGVEPAKDGHSTTYTLGEASYFDSQRATFVDELTVSISDTRTHRTKDGDGNITAKVRIGPYKSPRISFDESAESGAGFFHSHEASPADLRGVLKGLKGGSAIATRNRPSWRSVARKS